MLAFSKSGHPSGHGVSTRHRALPPRSDGHRFSQYRVLPCLALLLLVQLLSTIKVDVSNYLPADWSTEVSFEAIEPFAYRPPSTAELARLSLLETQLESKLTSLPKRKAVSCRSPRGRALCQSNVTLVWYNPSTRDKFLCGGKILLGPGMLELRDGGKWDACWMNPLEMSLTAHSFPAAPAVDNKALFPGIALRASQTQNIDDSFSSNLEQFTLPPNDNISIDLDRSKTDGLIYKVQGRKGEFGPERCDVKCEFEPRHGLIGPQFVYGTDWSIEFSIEGEHYYPRLHIGDYDWKSNKFFATTSFKSEIPCSYFSLKKNWWGNTLQSPAVPFSTGIKGASFLAKNCGSKNNREDVVKKLQATEFRVDSLSSCLKNAEPPPGVNMHNKTNVMEKYLLHLAFENGRTDDYITEKLWMAFHAGTIPVVLGPSNIKEHIGSIHGVIYVDDFASIQDLAEYLIKVSNNQTLYESYHAWRNEPYPEKFLEKYNFTLVHSSCRMCRWAYAKKYGLGWNHVKQSIEPLAVSRETCVESYALKSPVVESWWDATGSRRRRLNLTPSDAHRMKSLCPLPNSTFFTARIGDGYLIRSLWSHDGVTDLYLEGHTSQPHILRLQFPMAHDSIKFFNPYTVGIQNESSRISLAFNVQGMNNFNLTSDLAADAVEITIHPDTLPLRIRIIVEDQDRFHIGAREEPTYFGKIMAEDVVITPELFALDHN
ncbi:hypothetical protein HJC23_001594 [Cyclotella cryptica]|uniref:Fucosyltransferase n=1 Tax=Cyclotella cryptica TaxID=29204 RepID=A0ABD3P0N0_9STRA|eukprot:CCRYP_018814-RA/>CCRYP_018814-RA protein AED:0.02 eAED:0.02 QI:170/1/1/1/0.75/0.6/5/1181/711